MHACHCICFLCHQFRENHLWMAMWSLKAMEWWESPFQITCKVYSHHSHSLQETQMVSWGCLVAHPKPNFSKPHLFLKQHLMKSYPCTPEWSVTKKAHLQESQSSNSSLTKTPSLLGQCITNVAKCFTFLQKEYLDGWIDKTPIHSGHTPHHTSYLPPELFPPEGHWGLPRSKLHPYTLGICPSLMHLLPKWLFSAQRISEPVLFWVQWVFYSP